jgi:hypothetical protein
VVGGSGVAVVIMPSADRLYTGQPRKHCSLPLIPVL